jgi:hypothetical protein
LNRKGVSVSFDQPGGFQAAGHSRRVILMTGAKLAYATPIIAASMKLGGRGAAAVSGGQAFTVPSTNPGGVSTGISVTQGQQVCVSASGQVRLCDGDTTRNNCLTTPAGDDNVCLPSHAPGCCGSHICGVLLGSINGNIFELGASGCVPAPASGTLSLLISDCGGCFGDNSGSYTATITV